MAQQRGFSQWLRAWLPLFIAPVLLATVLFVVAKRWQQLHGTVVSATISQKLGREGSGSSGRYYLRAKYLRAQGSASHTRITTSSGTYDELVVGERVRVGYAHDPQNTLLASEWSFSGHLMVLALVALVILLNGLSDNKKWRNRRRDGYLPN